MAEHVYKVNLTNTELNVILNALTSMPYRDSAAVVSSLVGQINTQKQDEVKSKIDKLAE